MVGSLGAAGGRRKQMLAELSKADLAKNPAQRMVKSMSYGASKKVVDPNGMRPTDDRHKVLEKWLQAALNVTLGLNLKIDGILGPDTRAALRRFQKLEGLHSHGFLDDKTLQALELRVGMRAPRDGTLQGPSRLWQADRQAPVRPGPPPDKPKTDAAGREAQKEAEPAPAPKPQPEEQAPAAAREDKVEKKLAVEAPKLDEKAKAAQGLLQREAVQAVVQLAFAKDFAKGLLKKGAKKGEAELQAEMVKWFEKESARLGDAAPPWLQHVRELARERPDEAIAELREAWQRSHA